LVRIYPEAWRDRYGDEFTELLISEFEEEPTSFRRTANVVVTGSMTRLVPSGLVGQGLQPTEQIRASVVSLGCALAAFLAFGIAMWSQLTIGWQWSRPDTIGTTTAMIVTSATMMIFCALGLLAAAPIAWSVLMRFARRDGRTLLRPTLLFLAGSTLLIIGARHFGNGWPGTGGHPWADQGIVPGGMAAFTWASTLSVSAYWMHPGALSSFPTSEVAWMAISPIAIVCVVLGAASTVRRLELSPEVLRYESRLGSIASFAMIAFLTGCFFWIVDGGTGPRDLFHIGAIDIVEVVVMGLALAVARIAVHRAIDTRRFTPVH
jgi:hypothetical protein